jgi:ABC-type multidrug transport system permease subunit
MASHPLVQPVLARLREFYREPEAVFWVYGFPILMAVGLGIAFRNRPQETFAVDVQSGPAALAIARALGGTVADRTSAGAAAPGDARQTRFDVRVHDTEEARRRLRVGRAAVVVVGPANLPPHGSLAGVPLDYFYDPTRPESVSARAAVDDILQRAAGRKDPVPVQDQEMTETGSRYIDFLIPGLVGMNLLGGGMWGIGFVTVDMRVRHLLKRFLATPMKKAHFLGGMLISRFLFMVPEVLVLLVFARLAFGVKIHGSVAAVLFLLVLGAVTFAGLGLLIASRARTIESVSGLMNLVMLPMWLLSGIFFSSERFPAAAQPFIKALPLTPLNDALRAVMLDGASLTTQLVPLATLAAYAVVTFLLALRWFRWN